MTEAFKHLSHLEVSAFIDGELSANDTRDLQAHAAICHPCAMSLVSAMQLKAATIRASERFTAPPEALSRLTAQLRVETAKKPLVVYSFRPWAAWGALAASLVMVVLLLGWRAIHQTNTLQAELLDQHLAVLSSGSPPEVISNDRHTVKPWFQGKLPFSFNLPEAFPSGTVLKGGDLTFVNGQPAALLLFTVGKHQASVFLTQRPLNPQGLASSGAKSGFTIQYADAQELHITAVSDVNPSDLAHLVSALVNAQSAR